jgi:CBS domain-containing protein
MGSEGRGEYMLKTDQDNGLVLDDGADPEAARGLREAAGRRPRRRRLPALPGRHHGEQPEVGDDAPGLPGRGARVGGHAGRAGADRRRDLLRRRPVAGRADLAARAKQALFDEVDGNAAFHARFARAIDMFDEDGGGGGQGGFLGGLFGGRGEERLDIKKAGIFPLMHGVRALALERRLEETNTVQRIRRLTDLGLFDKARGQELADAFGYLLGLRLAARLERLRLHQTPDNLVNVAEISKLERDLLKDSLQIVKRFKEVVRHHFRLACSESAVLERLKRGWQLRRLKDPAYAHLFEDYAGDEAVSIDCETTGLDTRRDQILSIGAVRIRGDRS